MKTILSQLNIKAQNSGTSTGSNWLASNANLFASYSPVDGKLIADVKESSLENYEEVIKKSQEAYDVWKFWPAPKRGEIVKQIGQELTAHKSMLGKLIAYEMGKSLQEGYGEVQEMIDICDFAVGLSRQLHGLTMHSERPEHRMYEQWHPLGIVGIISSFNFPAAVWSWNTMLAWVCGNVCVWKPSEKTPLTAIACQKIIGNVFAANEVPEGVSCLITGGRELGECLSKDTRVPLISATGSTRMGKEVAVKVAGRLGKTLLELGGNNAVIVSKDADLDIAITGVVFGAVGTAGQRCTSVRRLIIHESIYEKFTSRLISAYAHLKIGDPLLESNHVGTLIDQDAVKNYCNALEAIEQQGGKFLVKGGVLEGKAYQSGCYVKPCIVAVSGNLPIVMHETFAPILYVMKYKTIQDAISLQNAVPQGLSSAIMSLNLREVELFLSSKGSDCGIANVNIGTSGAEIGGAFGGEKETGGGRESGSDAWKAYMRRQTCTINYGEKLPLAQGINFNI
ncbi:L-piperidine-6-carboxylate dehydrogenase [Pedobacter arcticus]|uniref:L-piperidine-6-carboxylate dehydrogenase n=1 Tax=Pedobacter arcticus TaxID=752140 RepID=UPI0002DCD8C9|nr:aldehyde dehydrogenase family protein [Pedobacter arcticus]